MAGQYLIFFKNAQLSGHKVVIRRISELPVAQVDQEVVDYAADWIELEQQQINILERNIQMINHKQGLSDQIPEALVESAIRFAACDPNAAMPYDFIHSRQADLDQLDNAIEAKDFKLKDRTSQLLAKGLRLRSTLSKKYKCEFNSLKSAQD